jgi:hypothetical protein
MPGPNSAPNGDARLVRGYPGQDWKWIKVEDELDDRFPGYWRDMRWCVRRTGKTDMK